LHFVLFVNYLFRFWIQWLSSNYKVRLLHFFVTVLICETVTSFAAIQFLYLVFTLRRQFILLNSSLNEVVMSTVNSEHILPLNVFTVSDFLSKSYSVISGLRDTLYRHFMLCDILELINSSYSLQVLAFIGLKFVYTTVYLYLLCFTLFDTSIFGVLAYASLTALVGFELFQLASVVYCCNSASFQVGIFFKNTIFRSVMLMEFVVLGGI
jgi:hypothetical protein